MKKFAQICVFIVTHSTCGAEICNLFGRIKFYFYFPLKTGNVQAALDYTTAFQLISVEESILLFWCVLTSNPYKFNLHFLITKEKKNKGKKLLEKQKAGK